MENNLPPQIYAPLGNLISRFEGEKARIDTIVENLDDDTMTTLAKPLEMTVGAYTFKKILKENTIYRSLWAKYWQSAFALGDFRNLMPAQKRNEWDEQIRELKVIEFTRDSVMTTLEQLIFDSPRMFAEKVDGVFRSLSQDHVTNQPEGFSKRIILYTNSYYRSGINNLYDLFQVIGTCYGVGSKYADLAYTVEYNIPKDGQWYWLGGNIAKIRCYKKGTAHFELHPDVVIKLNEQLHYLYPTAIPETFRTKKGMAKVKAPPIQDYYLQRETVKKLRDIARQMGTSTYVKTPAYTVDDTVKEVLELLGGVPSDTTIISRGNYRDTEHKAIRWDFDYSPYNLLMEVVALGAIPDKWGYQFYPTPTSLAQEVVDLAEIESEHSVLEPSCGNGSLLKFVTSITDDVTAIELSKLRAGVVKDRFALECIEADFLQWKNPKGFDRIVMNPPFTGNQALAHVQRAVTMLNPKGRLVAVVPSGFKGDIGLPYSLSDSYDNLFAGASVSVKILVAERG